MSSNRLCFPPFALLVGVIFCSSPAASMPQAAGDIVGRVVDGETMTPIGDAVVTLSVAQPPTSVAADFVRSESAVPITASRSTRTDATGRFTFDAVAEGNWSLSARAGGYLAGSLGQNFVGGPPDSYRHPAARSQAMPVIRLWQSAAVAGTVTDGQGRGVQGLTVSAVRHEVKSGRTAFSVVGRATTDSTGRYRVASLAPGEYAVFVGSTSVTYPTAYIAEYRSSVDPGQRAAMARNVQEIGTPPLPTAIKQDGVELQFTGMYRSKTVGALGPNSVRVFVPNTYPAGPENGGLLSLKSGDEYERADVQLSVADGQNIRGTLVGPDGAIAGAVLRLARIGQLAEALGAETDAGRTVTAPDGRFQFQGIPVGDYIVKMLRLPESETGASPAYRLVTIQDGSAVAVPRAGKTPSMTNAEEIGRPTLWVRTPIRVTREMSDVEIAAQRGHRLTGAVRFEGKSAQPSAEQLAGITVSLRPADELIATRFGRVSPDKTFSTYEFPQGRYFLLAPNPNNTWYLSKVLIDGRNVIDTAFELTADLANVQIVFTDLQTAIQGEVRDQNQRPVDGIVVLFPADIGAWVKSGMSWRTLKIAPSRNAAFRLTQLLPGTYLLGAVDPKIATNLNDPRVLANLARSAKRVTLAAGDVKVETLLLTQVGK